MSQIIPYQSKPHRVDDPLSSIWPASLPIELAMRESSPAEICRAYGIEREEFQKLGENPTFRAEVKAAVEMLRKEGASFRVRAQMQSVEYLKTIFAMVHDVATPPAVKARLMEFTIQASGLDASKQAGAANGKGGVAQAFQINIRL